MADPQQPKEPTLDDLRRICHADTLPLLERGDPNIRAALTAEWKRLQKPGPESEDETPRASFTDDDRDFPLPHESRSWKTGRERKVGVLRVPVNTLPKSETESEPPPEKTDVEKATDAANAALTERLEQSPEVQKAINDEAQQQVGFGYIKIGSADKKQSDTDWGYNERQAPQAYQIANDIAKAAAIAAAEEEARQQVQKRYRQRPEREDLVAKMLDSNAARRREIAEQEKAESSKPPEPSQPESGSGFGLWSKRLWANDIKPLFKATPTWIKWAIGLFLFGLTMIQIAEYLFALLTFIASGVFFALWIGSWDGWPHRKWLTKIVKVVLLSFVVGGFVSFTLILVSIKGTAPWTHLTRYVTRYFHGPVIPTPSPTPPAAEGSDSSLSDDSQYELLQLSADKKAEVDKLKATLFQMKAKMLDAPEYYKLRVAKDNFRTTVEQIEQRCRSLLDTVTVTCQPKPPVTITSQEMEVDVSVRMVARELSKNYFWVIRDGVKLRVPIVLFVSLTNRHKEPIKVDLLYLEAKSVGGWIDTRMADSLDVNKVQGMDKKPLVLQGKNGAFSMKGEYLIPALYDRVIQPGDTVEGWIIAEYPKGIVYGNSIGDMRISLLAANHWIASKTFPANPTVFDKINSFDSKEFYFAPLDTFITEDR